MISGCCMAARYFSPNTKIIGAEPSQKGDASNSITHKSFLPNNSFSTICDGLKVPLGSKTFAIMNQLVEKIISIEEHEIISANQLLMERLKILIEPSSAICLAAILKEPEMFRGK